MENVILYIIIGLVVLLVVSVLLSGNLLAIIEEGRFLPESMIKITGEPLISHSKNDKHLYTITIPAEIEYTGKWEIGGKGIDSVDVVSLINFKGIDKNASADGENTFLLTKINPKFEGELSAYIESDAGPIKKIGSSYDSEMKRHESFLLTTEDDGNFLVTFELYVYPYGGKFAIECETDKRYVELMDWLFCQEDSAWYPGEYNKCERYLEICDGTVHIRLVGPTYKKIGGPYLTDEVMIEAEGEKPFEPGERVEVSFWRSSECIDKYNSFDEILSNCARDFLGYSSLEGVIIEGTT